MAASLLILALVLNIVQCQREGEPCSDRYTNAAGICVRADQCQSARNDLQQNGISPTFCEYEAFAISVVCCRDGKNILQTVSNNPSDDRPVWGATFPSDTQQIQQTQRKRVSERKCEKYSRHVIEEVPYIVLTPDPDTLSLSFSKCNYTGVELIVGGEDTSQGEFPHMAAIGWATPEGGYKFDCGGSLISPKFVLTAGHCSLNNREEPVIVRLGDQNIDPAVFDGAKPVDVPIRRIHSHPEYFSPITYNDIALVELSRNVKFNADIRPACLWTRGDFSGHTKALATGWGVVDTETQQASKELQKVSLSLLQNDYCDRLLIDLRNRNWREGFVSSQMCAGELRGGKDTCQGDSGSPLQVTSKDNHCIYHIIGVTSFGKSCAKSGLPAVYTRVSSFLDWIESIVWPGE